MLRWLARLTALVGLVWMGATLAADAGDPNAKLLEDFSTKKVGEQLRRLDRALDDADLSREQFARWNADLAHYLEQVNACEVNANQQLQTVNTALKALPEDSKNDTPELKGQRSALNKQVKDFTSRASACALLRLNLNQLSERLINARRAAEEQFLTRRETPIWGGGDSTGEVSDTTDAPEAATTDWWEASRSIWETPPIDATWLWSSLLLSLGVGFALRIWVRPEKLGAERSFSARFFNGVARSAFYHAPLVLLLISAWAYGRAGYLGSASEYWMRVFVISGLALVALIASESLSLCIPGTEAERRRMRYLRWALRLSFIQVLPWFASIRLLVLALKLEPPVLLVYPTLGVSLMAILFALTLFVTAWLLWPLLRPQSFRIPLTLAMVGFLFAAVADAAGYRILGRLAIYNLLETGLLLLAVRLLTLFFDDFFRALEGGHREWQRRLHEKLGLRDDENIPGLIPLHITLVLVLWVSVAVLLLRIWGLSDESFDKLLKGLSSGFVVGQIKIVPENILIGLLLFAGLLTASRWVRQRLEGDWVPESKMSKGGREAVATVFWYAGCAGAALAGLSFAGIDLSSLAVIAGALSVGIGFGLQNVVNNFISGLILLLERPIRPGDWVVVGGTQGYVQKISIRSTRIKTFDRADVIVPNSEFITGQVTNWMLNDTYGRVVVPIGVAYGSNVDQVREILLDIINNHPEVVKNDPKVAPPRVLFRTFADSSLNFEVRAVIRNVEDTSLVVSDLNFAIEKAFRENNIDIPFPQRTLHIRYPDGVPTVVASPIPGVPLDKLNDHE